MGNKNAKSSLRNAIIYLSISAEPISVRDDKFWDQILSEDPYLAGEVIRAISAQEIRMLRDGSPRNFSLLAYKMVECLNSSTATLCNTESQQTAVLNAIRILTRITPCVFEDKAWRNFFEINYLNSTNDTNNDTRLIFPEKSAEEKDYMSYLPNCSTRRMDSKLKGEADVEEKGCDLFEINTNDPGGKISRISNDLLISEEIEWCSDKLSSGLSDSVQSKRGHWKPCLMRTMITSVCDLLFCPEFTVLSHGESCLSNAVDAPPEDLRSLSTNDYIWEPGVGFDSSANSTQNYDNNRSDLLRALLACMSSTLYERPDRSNTQCNHWMEIFISSENRHALPLFTSLLNVIFAPKPFRPILHFAGSSSSQDNRDILIELSLHVLLAALDYKIDEFQQLENVSQENLFIEYMSRIHRDEDYAFIVHGFTRLFNDRMCQRSLWAPAKTIELDLELMLMFWKLCNYNRKFMLYLLRSTEALNIVVPILYYLNENFQVPSKTALIHLGVFNLLILSGERNFGVKLNKQYSNITLNNLPEFQGSHADLMIIVFHKLIMYGYKVNQLYDYLLSILVNISPYLKNLTTLASKCLIQLFETFSSTFVIFTEPNYHQLVVFLLEIFNNLIQYQFDSNTNLIYVLLNKKDSFVKLACLSTSQNAIDKVLRKLIRRKMRAKRKDTVTLEEKLDHSESMNPDNYDDILCEDVFDVDLATVSNKMGQYDSSSCCQEVSLVATPKINHFTQSTHPFVADVDTNQGELNQQPEVVKQMFQEPPPMIFDDIMNQSSDFGPFLSKGTNLESPNDDSISDKSKISSETGSRNCETSTSSKDRTAKDSMHKKWRPTSEWLKEWKRTLPLQTVIRMIAVLLPQVEQIKRSCARSDEAEIFKFLQNGTLVGLLPVPRPILIRKYRTNKDSTIWFRACTWAIIYVKSTTWTNTNIHLIRAL